MYDKTPPTAHAEITAPISADLRRMVGGEQPEALQQSAQPDALAEVSKEQYARMFNAACEALGQISDHLGIDSDINPGAEPIIEAIDELRAAALQAAPPAPAAVAVPDDFRGDTATLVRNIIALLELDAEGALVPHGVGGHARGLLSAAASRLAASDKDQGCTRSHPHENMSPMCGLRTEIARLNQAAANAGAQEVARDHTAVLCDLLNRRPAMNSGLDAEYAAWSDECYRVRGALSQAAANDDGAQEDARDLEAEALRACRDLPEGWEIVIHLEKGYGGVVLIDPEDNENDLPVDGMLFDALKESIDQAVHADAARAAQGGGSMSQGQSAPAPLNYDPADPDKMNLPKGVTCGDCVHIRRCKGMFGHTETDTYCDWSPSRFYPAAQIGGA